MREGEVMPQYYNEKLNACALDRCLLRAMDMIGWRDKPLAVALGDRVRALGCALTMQGSGISNVDIAGIDMRLEEDGFISIGTGATDNGMGVDTILAQIAAEELGVESSLIVVRGVDTDVSPFDAGSYASSGTYVTGLKPKNAAAELREKICAKAAQMWDVDAADVVFDGQYVRLSDERAARERGRYLTLRDFANLCVKNIEGGDAVILACLCLPARFASAVYGRHCRGRGRQGHRQGDVGDERWSPSTAHRDRRGSSASPGRGRHCPGHRPRALRDCRA